MPGGLGLLAGISTGRILPQSDSWPIRLMARNGADVPDGGFSSLFA